MRVTSVNRALMERFAQNGTWLDPTIQSFRYFAPTQWDAIFAGFRKMRNGMRLDCATSGAGKSPSSHLCHITL